MSEARHAGDLFLSDEASQALRFTEHLKTLNDSRKEIERSMAKHAKQQAAQQHAQGRQGLSVFLPEGNPGVVGIVASRVTQAFGKPACILAPMVGEPDLLTGSLRSPDEFNIKDGIAQINQQHPGLLERGGGHAKAGGVSFLKNHLDSFQQAFDEAVKAQTRGAVLAPRIDTDGELPAEFMTLALLAEIEDLQPFGQGFPKPVFEGTGLVKAIRLVGSPKVHAQLTLNFGRTDLKAIWFFALENEHDELPVETGRFYRFVYSLSANTFNANTQLQLIIEAITKTKDRQ